MGRTDLAVARQSRIEASAQSISDPIARLQYLRRNTSWRQAPARRPIRWIACVFLVLLASSQAADFRARTPITLAASIAAAAAPAAPSPNVWPVEETADYEVFSNGLRVEDTLAVAHQPRMYRLISRSDPAGYGPQRSVPAGIVFHTTESGQAPFEPGETRHLQRIGRELLLYLRQKRSYHFLIDRFGRVHRIVRESDTANHAGHSAWADSRWLYVGLNESFLG